jgi:hypothetical protein
VVVLVGRREHLGFIDVIDTECFEDLRLDEVRMSAGTRSSAITATAPASSASLAWSAVTTSMMTPPLSIWARPFLVVQVEVSTVM